MPPAALRLFCLGPAVCGHLNVVPSKSKNRISRSIELTSSDTLISEIQCISEISMSTTMVHVRIDEKTKQRAAKTLAGMGISVSDAVRMLLVRVAAEKALPFEVKVPNSTTIKAMRAADKGKGKRYKSADALFKDLGI
jgi:DNA-damage-inducible protein J